jgi:arylsulfatase A-like enzyme
MKNLQSLFGITIFFLLLSCQPPPQENKISEQQMPNILWLVAEDMSPNIPPFGDSTIQTPNLSRLAAEGVRYTNVYSVSGVCSPSRAAIATGMYPNSIGAHHMRTLYQQPAAREKGLINYECVPPVEVKMLSEIMRQNAYYCTNNRKEDYQFFPSKMAWDESSFYAHWRNRPEGKAFFSIFNFGVTHESNLWNPGYRHFDHDTFPPPREKKNFWKGFENGAKPWAISDSLQLNIPPYLPNNDIVRKDVRRMYSNIAEMDKHVGMILNQLEKDGLLENTIIVWFTDHGGPLPRQKRLLYDAGIHVPMIIRYPHQKAAGTIDNQLISFIDFAPNLLSLIQVKPPDWMQGRPFSGQYKPDDSRSYIHAAADRFDETYDMIRAVRDHRFKYLKNFHTDQPYYLPLAYRENMASMQELLRLRKENQLDSLQMLWFRETKPEEELFDTVNDPHELHNLANDPNYAAKLIELRRECERWMNEIEDKGFIKEIDLIETFWPDKIQPITSNPIINKKNNRIHISCLTEGASIGYKLTEDEKDGLGWRIYEEPLDIKDNQPLKVIAHRLGYAVSDTISVN